MVARVADNSAPLAIVGMVGRWPGGCDDEAARWQLRGACGDAVGGVPATRWTLALDVDVRALSSVVAACVRHGGFLASAQRFDGRALRCTAQLSVSNPGCSIVQLSK